MANELWQTDVNMDAVLDEVSMSLRDVLEWQVGSQLLLSTPPDGLVQLRCGDVPMFQGRMGRRKGNIAVRIERDSQKTEERQR